MNETSTAVASQPDATMQPSSTSTAEPALVSQFGELPKTGLGARGFRSEVGGEHPIGSSEGQHAAVSRPTPLPKRPKGRLFVGGLLAIVCTLACHGIWDGFFRFRAYGLVVGRVIQVAAPWDGTIERLNVREGESFSQSQVLVAVDNLQLHQQLDRVGDELRLAQAELDAEISRLRWQSQEHVDRSRTAIAEHHKALGVLLNEHAKLQHLERRLDRAKDLKAARALTDESWDEVSLGELGQRQMVEKLRQQVDELEKRAQELDSLNDEGTDQIRPRLVAIERLQSEFLRVRDQITQGRVVAPVSGNVIQIRRLSGESVKAMEPLIEIVEEGSLEVVIYLRQKDANRLHVGDEISLDLVPYPERMTCVVVRLGQRFEMAPAAVQRYYWRDESLFPVYLKPRPEYEQFMALRIGGVVKLPFSG